MLREVNCGNLVPDSGSILQLDGGLDGAIVVVDDDGAHHLGALDVGDPQREAVDDVTADEFDDLRRRGEADVGLERRVLDGGEGHFGGRTRQTGIPLQVESVQVDHGRQAVVQHRVGMPHDQLVLFFQQRYGPVHVARKAAFQT